MENPNKRRRKSEEEREKETENNVHGKLNKNVKRKHSLF